MFEPITSDFGPATPEKYLLAAVLRRAVFDYVNGVSDDRDSAAEWFFYVDEKMHGGGGIFSFTYVCEHLGFDASAIRNRLAGNPELWEKAELAA